MAPPQRVRVSGALLAGTQSPSPVLKTTRVLNKAPADAAVPGRRVTQGSFVPQSLVTAPLTPTPSWRTAGSCWPPWMGANEAT